MTLVNANLITEHIYGRYAFHDLLRAYAIDLADTLEPPEADKATGRMLDHYLHTAHMAALLINPTRDPLTLTAPRAGTTPEIIEGHDQAMAWFAVEHRVLVATIDKAVTASGTHTWQLAWTLVNFLDRQGHWHDWAATQLAAVAASGRLADPAAQATAHRNLAWAYTRLGRLDDAHTHLSSALELYQHDPEGRSGRAHTHMTLGMVCEQQRRYGEALDHVLQALDLYRATGQRAGQADALNAAGWCHGQLGDHEQAFAHCRQALSLQRELGSRVGQADTLNSLGHAHRIAGQHHQAIDCYWQSINLFREIGDRYELAGALTSLGDVNHEAGDTAAAGHAWQAALTILDELGHTDATQVRAKLIALRVT